MVGGFCWILVFLFVPETFWDRTPRPKSRGASKNTSRLSLGFFRHSRRPSRTHVPPKIGLATQADGVDDVNQEKTPESPGNDIVARPSQTHRRSLHVGFASENSAMNQKTSDEQANGHGQVSNRPGSHSSHSPTAVPSPGNT